MTNFAILRTAKLKTYGNIGGSIGHTYRKNNLAPNANSRLTSHNKTLVGNKDNPIEDIRKRIDSLNCKIRSDNVLCIEYLLTSSPEFFKGKTKKQIDLWASKNIEFLQKTHGKENVVHCVLHLDETTPHLVAYVIPEHQGKLNAKEFLGGREKMRNLQSQYSREMSKFGLSRGIEGSKARHQKVKTFYTDVNNISKAAKKELENISKPAEYPVPTLKAVFSKEHRETEKINFQKEDKQRKERLVKTAGKALLSAKEANKLLRDVKQENSAMTAEIEYLKQRLSDVYDQLELPKDEISKLRKLDISQVAERLGYFDEIKKGENSIDLVKRINSFDYQQSVAWLSHEFGSAGAAAAVRENLEIEKPARPFSKSENVMKKNIITQLDALGCDKYRISLIPNEGSGVPYLPGKSGTEEKFYSKAEIVNLIPYLRYENNAEKKNVFITPMDDHAYYVLLDDLNIENEQFLKLGFKPCLIQNTSWNSKQAVLKIPKSEIDRADVITFFNSMNKEMGDKSITGLRHAMRLAGFRNLKPKHEKEGLFPFVKLRYAVNQFCKKSYEIIKNMGKEKQETLENTKFIAPKF